jgi:hypothetical protein
MLRRGIVNASHAGTMRVPNARDVLDLQHRWWSKANRHPGTNTEGSAAARHCWCGLNTLEKDLKSSDSPYVSSSEHRLPTRRLQARLTMHGYGWPCLVVGPAH